MPSLQSMMDNNMPTFDSSASLKDQVKGLYDYVFQLLEQIRYSWRNIDPEKQFNQAASQNYEQKITGPINQRFEGVDGSISQLQVDSKQLRYDVYGPDGSGQSAGLLFDVNGLNITVNGSDGQSGLKFDVNGLQTEIYGKDGKSGLKFDVNGLQTEIYGADGTGETAGLKFGLNGLSVAVKGADGTGKTAGLQFTMDGLYAEMYGKNGTSGIPEQGSVKATANTFNTFYGRGGAWSQYTQKADKIDWIVASGTSASSMTMTQEAIEAITGTLKLTAANGQSSSTLTLSAGSAELSSADVKITGMVTFESLNPGAGYTGQKSVIDGGLIKAGSIIFAPLICWGNMENKGAYGFLDCGTGYSDDGQTQIVEMYSMYGIKIKCGNRNSGIALESEHVWCDCDPNSFGFTIVRNGREVSIGLVDLIQEVIAGTYP